MCKLYSFDGKHSGISPQNERKTSLMILILNTCSKEMKSLYWRSVYTLILTAALRHKISLSADQQMNEVGVLQHIHEEQQNINLFCNIFEDHPCFCVELKFHLSYLHTYLMESYLIIIKRKLEILPNLIAWRSFH